MPSTVPDTAGMRDKLTHVAVGVVQNAKAEILITKRPGHLHQGGLWEFPGGKLEQDEDVFDALQRELKEEVGITIDSAEPLIQIPFHYPDKSVLLDVLCIKAFSGTATGLEGQALQWVPQSQLAEFSFPLANQAIINALRLPDAYLITGEFENKQGFLSRLHHGLKQGIKLVQLRTGQLPEKELALLAEEAKSLCGEYQAQLLVNTNAELAKQLDVGLHLNSQSLLACDKRPIGNDKWLAASVHNETELHKANRLGVDFIVLSPVLPTSSHPGAPVLGWETFESMVGQSAVPVYALGGMSEADITTAKQRGAQGIAAISTFWKRP